MARTNVSPIRHWIWAWLLFIVASAVVPFLAADDSPQQAPRKPTVLVPPLRLESPGRVPRTPVTEGVRVAPERPRRLETVRGRIEGILNYTDANGQAFSRVVLNTVAGRIHFEAGPTAHLDQHHLMFRAGEELELVGTWVGESFAPRYIRHLLKPGAKQ